MYTEINLSVLCPFYSYLRLSGINSKILKLEILNLQIIILVEIH